MDWRPNFGRRGLARRLTETAIEWRARNGIRAADPVPWRWRAGSLPGAGKRDADRAEAVPAALRYRK
jgi:hypothetical protein